MRCAALIAIAASVCAAGLQPSAETQPAVGALAVHHAAGQTFITWEQRPDERAVYRVYQQKDRPITDVSSATLLGTAGPQSSLNAGATRFTAGGDGRRTSLYYSVPPGRQLTAQHGLFVWTATADADVYHAVTVVRDGREDTSIVLGVNATSGPIRQSVALAEPVLQGSSVGHLKDVLWYAFWLPWLDTPRMPAMSGAANSATNFVIRGMKRTAMQPLIISLAGIGGGWWEIDQVRIDVPVLHFADNTHQHGYYCRFQLISCALMLPLGDDGDTTSNSAD